ncbi:hypothetical protein [Streptomyces boluensis]|uniref:Uncharacterized protein n=1 Tax=Streptomyces boluensis TaxID=1775135 RepID=A0A964UN34_9ACTN|nr:hypothetical protein [Streptomyces boluensis]NBE50818.1 hypothetical protein [Streptomyces boluensis]
MHGGLPFIGISTLIYGAVGLVVLAVSVVRTRIRDDEATDDPMTSGGAAR